MTHPLSAPAHPPILFYQSPRMKSNIFSKSNLKYKIFKPLGSKLSLCVLLFFFFARGNTLENPRVSDDFNLYWRLFEKFSEYFLQDGEGNEHLFEKIWCHTTVVFSYENFFFRRPKKWDISPI